MPATANWSRVLVIKDGIRKSEHTCCLCNPYCVKIYGLSDEWPKYCIDADKKRKYKMTQEEEKELRLLVAQEGRKAS